jgi:hypothetical protein
MMRGVPVNVTSISRDDVPRQAYTSRLYTAADIEAMIDMLAEQPVLLGNSRAGTEEGAKSRARTLRRYLADYGVMVTTRTWPEFDGETVQWSWCVMLREDGNG